MKKVKVFNFKSIDDLKNNWEEYKKPLLEEGVFVLRNANFSLEEQARFQEFLGTKLNCYPNEKDKKNDYYLEDHSRNSGEVKGKKDEVLLNWHIEHENYDNAMVLGIWNMTIFKTDKENGNTVFVDTSKIFNKLKLEDQNFLKKVLIERTKDTFSPEAEIYNNDFFQNNILSSDFIREHWFTKENIIRTSFTIKHELYKIENREPNEQEKERFNNLISYIWDEVKYNKDNWLVQEWEENDLLVVDLEKMAHCVFGGFKSEDRLLQGMFSHEKNTELFPIINLNK